LDRHDVNILENKIERLEIANNTLHDASFDIVFDSGNRLHRTALFSILEGINRLIWLHDSDAIGMTPKVV